MFNVVYKSEWFQFSSVAQSCLTFCDPMDCSMPGLPVYHQFAELAQAHVHRVGDAIQPSHPLSCPSPPAFSLSQYQCLFQWVSSSHQVAKVLEFQLQHQSFQWIFRTDFLEDGLVGSPCSPRDSLFFFFNFILFFKLYIIVLVLPNIKMNPPQVLSRVFSNTTVQKHPFFDA